MAKLSKREISQLKYSLSKMAFSLTGTRIAIVEIKSDDDIGYTNPGKSIHLNFNHPYTNTLSKTQSIRFVRGVFAHEVMHRLLTDFRVYVDANKKHQMAGIMEGQIFATLNNVLEDSFIENYGHIYLADALLKDLHFMRAWVYSMSPIIQESGSPIGEFINASINYGDAGFVKGEFTSDEARECFAKALPVMDKGVFESKPQKRIALIEQILDISRPLWNEFDPELLKALESMLDSMIRPGEGTPSGGGADGIPLEALPDSSEIPEGDPSDKRKGKRRALTRKKFLPESEDAGSGSEGTDGPVSAIDDASEGAGKKTEDRKRDAGSGKPKDAGEDTGSSSSGSADKSDRSDKPSGADDAASDSSGDGESEYSDEDVTDSIDEDMSFTAEDEARILKEMEAAEAALKDDDAKSEESASTPLEYDVGSGYKEACKGKRCNNIRIRQDKTEEAMAAYRFAVESMQTDIARLTNQLKRIFKNDRDSKTYRSCGRVDVKRASSGKVTTKLFEKRNAASNKADMAITILVDESGSMGGVKITNARACTIMLAEVFANLKIPFSVIGFSGDENGYHAVHRHYLNWGNSKTERLKLLSIKAHCENFDGYSIRYAGKYNEHKNAEHRLLIVISDGAPACSVYYGGVNGVADTKLAIKEASKNNTVLGILLGGSSPALHKEMYGYNFTHIANPNELSKTLGKIIAKLIKGW